MLLGGSLQEASANGPICLPKRKLGKNESHAARMLTALVEEEAVTRIQGA